jgi:hypothetical protein
MNSRIFGLLALLPLGACGLSTPMTSEHREALDTCRADTERVFNTQHRELLSERDSSDSPYSGNTLPIDPNRGLADRYQHEQMVDNCMRSAGEPGSSNPSPAAAVTPASSTP